jgi:hypothetical protein
VGDEDDAIEGVRFDEETKLSLERRALEGRAAVPGEAPRPARNGDAVVARQAEPFVQKLVHLLAKSSVGAIDRRRADTILIEWMMAGVNRRGIAGRLVLVDDC